MAIIKDNLDTRMNPGKDFYQFANGGWLVSNPLPDEFSRYGTFDKLAEDNQKMVRELIENAASKNPDKGSLAAKVGDFYSTGMDTAKIEAEGIKPLSDIFDFIDKATTSGDVWDLITQLHKKNLSLVFYLYGAPDRKNSEMVIANLYQGGLGLTDVDYYSSEDEKSREMRKKYKEYIAEMLILTGLPEDEAHNKAKIIFSMEDRLAKSSMTRLERRNPHLTYNKMLIRDFDSQAPSVNWNLYFDEMNLGEIKDVNVSQPGFFKELNHMISDIAVEEWKDYLKWHVLNNSASYLSSDFVNTNFDFYGKYLSGKKSIQPRWKRVLQVEDYALGEAIGQMFVEKHFPPEAKERMLELVGNLKIALEERIELLDWMSAVTKEEAKEKLAAMNVKIGYPDKWRDYTGLEVNTDSYFENITRAMQFNLEYRISKIGKPVDPDEWSMTPQTVNAYYNPSRNEIVFPAGILQPPFFYMKADDAVNYGAIGVVIGHEMTHGFDDQGRKFDKQGNLTDWWTEEDAAKFNERSKLLVEQFNQFPVMDDIKANGELTLGENIADLGGLNIAFTALKKAWEKEPPKAKIKGFTPEQRFFLAYAHVWAQNITNKEILRRTKEDVHSLGRLRVNGPLPNMPEFYTAFNIDENSPMYLAEDQRAVIW
ncbi:MAG: M13 family metallopeptidase [Bacteroidales bacterium]